MFFNRNERSERQLLGVCSGRVFKFFNLHDKHFHSLYPHYFFNAASTAS